MHPALYNDHHISILAFCPPWDVIGVTKYTPEDGLDAKQYPYGFAF